MSEITQPQPLDIAREVFPDKDDKKLIGYIWMTGYPSYWHTDDPVTELRQTLEEIREIGVDAFEAKYWTMDDD